MGRGLFSGIFSGTLVSGIALAAASLLNDQPAGNSPPVRPQIEAPLAGSGDMTAGTVPAGVEAMEDSPTLSATPSVAAPTAENDAPVADTAPAVVPQTGTVAADLGAPDGGTSAPLIDMENTLDPVLPTPQTAAPQVPVAEDDITLSTDPVQPVAPMIVDDTAFDENDGMVLPDPEPEEFVVMDPEDDAPVIADEDSASTDAAVADAMIDETPGAESDATPQAPATAPAIQLQGDTSTLPTADDSGVIIRRPVGETAPASDDTAATGGDALERFAAAHDNSDGKPLLSVVLIDDGAMPGASAALAGLPFPVTIALDPSAPDAAAKMAAYRAAGVEVAALINLPGGAAPSDVEVAFAAYFAVLPEAVLVLDNGEGGLQSDIEVTRQAMEILAADGRALVSVSQGLNQAMREAERAQVPAAVVYRDLDSEGQDARVIRRFLDQAAFRARQQSGVVLLGRVRPDTISALILWGTANRAGQVSVAPVSAVLLAQE